MAVSIAKSSGNTSRPPTRRTGCRGAVHAAAAIAALILIAAPVLASPTVRFGSHAAQARRAAACQERVAALCKQAPNSDSEQCRMALTASCLRGELQEVCGNPNDGAVLCQRQNGLVVLRNACRGCKTKAGETEIGTLESGGASGVTGPTGPPGPPGQPGAQGPLGAPGAAGAAGAPGPVGPVGPTGPVGPAGVAGLPGPTGPPGGPGAIGATGATGATGPTGVGTTVRVTVETKTITKNRPTNGELIQEIAECPAGQQATGGGVSTVTSNTQESTNLHTLESGPVPGAIPPTKWLGRIAPIRNINGTLTLTVYVLCVPAP